MGTGPARCLFMVKMVHSHSEDEAHGVRRYGSFLSVQFHTHENFSIRSRFTLFLSCAVLATVCVSAMALIVVGNDSFGSVLIAGPQFSMVDISAEKRVTAREQPSSETSHILHIDMPISQMEKLKIGSVVKGHVRLPMLANSEEHVGNEFSTVPFTGEVCTGLYFMLSRVGMIVS